MSFIDVFKHRVIQMCYLRTRLTGYILSFTGVVDCKTSHKNPAFKYTQKEWLRFKQKLFLTAINTRQYSLFLSLFLDLFFFLRSSINKIQDLTGQQNWLLYSPPQKTIIVSM